MKTRTILLLCCFAALLFCLPACTGDEARAAWLARIEQLEGAQANVQDRMSELAVLAEDLRAELAAMPEDAAGRDTLSAYLDQVTAAKAEIDAYGARIADAIADVKADIQAAGDSALAVNASGAGSVLTTAAPLLPPPWNGIAAIGGTLLGAIGAAAAKRRGEQLKDVVFAIDTAKRSDETFASALNGVGGVVRSAMGKATATKVDQIRK